jgi:hypothetical protein
MAAYAGDDVIAAVAPAPNVAAGTYTWGDGLEAGMAEYAAAFAAVVPVPEVAAAIDT